MAKDTKCLSWCLLIAMLASCAHSGKSERPLRTERTILNEDIERAVIIREDDTFKIEIFGDLSEVSYYAEVVTRTEAGTAKPVDGAMDGAFTAIGTALFLPLAIFDPAGYVKQVGEEFKKNGERMTGTTTSSQTGHEIKEVKRLGLKDTKYVPASNAKVTVLLACSGDEATLSFEEKLDANGKLPRSKEDLLKEFLDRYGSISSSLDIKYTVWNAVLQSGRKDTSIETQKDFSETVSKDDADRYVRKIIVETNNPRYREEYVKRHNNAFSQLLIIENKSAKPAERDKACLDYLAAHKDAFDGSGYDSLRRKYLQSLEKELYSKIMQEKRFQLVADYNEYVVRNGYPNRLEDIRRAQTEHQQKADREVYESTLKKAITENKPELLRSYTEGNTGSALADEARREHAQLLSEVEEREYTRVLEEARKSNKPSLLKEYVKTARNKELIENARTEYFRLSRTITTKPSGSTSLLKLYQEPDILSDVLREEGAGKSYVLHKKAGDFYFVEYELDRFGYIYKGFVE